MFLQFRPVVLVALESPPPLLLIGFASTNLRCDEVILNNSFLKVTFSAAESWGLLAAFLLSGTRKLSLASQKTCCPEEGKTDDDEEKHE